MAKKRYTQEQIINKFLEAEILFNQGFLSIKFCSISFYEPCF